ncbi:ABC transporter ATP-binding protein [Weissella viridescens]|uniref:ABC-type quaternary amine transporter n=1 Tax=Weissella viridescens TaxID=1629 RepID=A0A3P2REQ4_WEIVI|nr:ABC transporter ATP-binding protein [Weissella viridescens]
MIQFDHVSKIYDQEKAVQNVSLTIQKGEFFVLVGASGSGKTTTLKMINRLLTPSQGRIIFQGRDIAALPLKPYRHHVGYVLQTSALFPNMSVLENAAVTLNAQGIKTKAARPKIEQLLSEVGLDPNKYAQRMPHELSGGEQQRVGIVRALAAEPEVILMDEPFSALDPISRQQLQQLVAKLHEKLRTTIIFVTHDMDEALQLGTRIGVMQHGLLEQVDTPTDIVLHPKNAQVAAMFKTQQAPTVSDLIALGFYQLKDDTSNLPTIKPESTLAELAQAFLNQSEQLVQGNDHMVVTQHDYLRYMAQQ